MRSDWSWIRIPAMLALSMSLGACSPHPASGNWTGSGAEPSIFSRLDVHFDGRAELYRPGEEKEALHCFWGGDGPRSILLDCTAAEDVETKLRYGLWIGEDGGAELLQGRKRIALFRRATK